MTGILSGLFGGDSSQQSSPSATNNTNSVLAPYVAQYGQNLLGQAAAVTGIGSSSGLTPYQAYSAGQAAPNGQVAGFSDLQNQSFNSAQNMQAAPQIGTATNLAGSAGIMGLGSAGSAMGFGNQGAYSGQQGLNTAGAAMGYGAQGYNAGQQGMHTAGNAMGFGNQGFQAGQQGLSTAGAAMGFGNQGFQAGQAGMNTAGAAMGYGAQGYGAGQQGLNTAGAAMGYGAQGYGAGQQGLNTADAALNYGAQGAQAGLGYGQNAQRAQAVGNYMNPYLQQSLAPQMALLAQQQGQQHQVNQAQATQAGAFGGSRMGVQNALQNQSDQLAMSNLIGTGYNNAFNTANTNMQQAAALGMQGAQAGQAGVAGAQQAAQVGIQGAQAGQAGVTGAQQAAQVGIQGAQAGVAGINSAQNAAQLGIAGAQAGQAGVAGAQQAAQVGIQGAQAGVAGINSAQNAAQLGIAGAQAGQAGVAGAQNAAQVGIQGAQAGLAGVAGAQNGYNMGISAANQLGQLGTNQYTQNMGITNLQNQYGAQQQQYQQNLDTAAYQNYQNQQQLPYQQLGFMGSMLQGLPTSGSTSSVYSQPSLISIAAGLGTAAVGANKPAAKGGLMSLAKGGGVKAFAEGGVTSPDSIARIVHNLSTSQLQQLLRASNDPVAKQAAVTELGQRQPQAPQGITQLPAQNMTAMADGGIVGYADGGVAQTAPEPWSWEARKQAIIGGLRDTQQFFNTPGQLHVAQPAAPVAQPVRAATAQPPVNTPPPAQQQTVTPPQQTSPQTVRMSAPQGGGLMSIQNAMQQAGVDSPKSIATNYADLQQAAPYAGDEHLKSLSEQTMTLREAALANGIDPEQEKQFKRLDAMEQKAEKLLERKQNMAIIQAGLGMIKAGNPWEAIAGGASKGISAYGEALDQSQASQQKLLESRNALEASKQALNMGLFGKAVEQQAQAKKLFNEYQKGTIDNATKMTDAQLQRGAAFGTQAMTNKSAENIARIQSSAHSGGVDQKMELQTQKLREMHAKSLLGQFNKTTKRPYGDEDAWAAAVAKYPTAGGATQVVTAIDTTGWGKATKH